jgi:LuxR family transcriptional regulator, maltose regulon positive regulatory protein
MYTTHSPQTAQDYLDNGQLALEQSDWRQARACFEAALQEQETAVAWEGLAMAAWGLNDTPTTIAAREEAYRLYRQQDDRRGAARVAINVATDHFYFRGEQAIATGWMQRADRLLAAADACPEKGWLALAEAQILIWVEHDFVAAHALATKSARLGRNLADVNLEMLALAFAGICLVGQGQIDEGMRQLDEATLAAVIGEITIADAACTACCCLIFACEWTRDYGRAYEWIERSNELSDRWSHPTHFYFCQTHYAKLLIWRGEWGKAESSLVQAVRELEVVQPALAAEALIHLAGLRCRQGRFAEASELLARAESPPYRTLVADFCLLGRATLALADGQMDTAVDLTQRFLRAMPEENRMERFAGLELLLLAQVQRGDREGAQQTLAEIQATATLVGTQAMQAAARFAEGLVALAANCFDEARRCLEDAVELWDRTEGRHEAALARLELAHALQALGRPAAAARQAERACETFRQLGAVPDATRARELLAEIEKGSTGEVQKDTAVADLTPRELDVLRLLAAGLSNQEISHQLVISVRTTERHISNIYDKIGTSGKAGRAVATAFALQHGLTD